MNTAYSIVRYLQQLCEEIETVVTMPTPMKGDCKPLRKGRQWRPARIAAQWCTSRRPRSTSRTGSTLDADDICLEWVAGTDCAADALTKALGRTLFEKFKPFLLGDSALLDIHASSIPRGHVMLQSSSVDMSKMVIWTVF
eukprot:g311.t1